MTPQLPPTTRLTILEQGLDNATKRMEKYDQILSGMQRSQDKYDILLQNFADEMKVLHSQEVDLSKLIAHHDTSIVKIETRWHRTLGVTKWIGGTSVSVGLVYLGVYLAHIFH